MSACVLLLSAWSYHWMSSDKAEEYKLYEALLELCPDLEGIILACDGHRAALHNLIKLVSSFTHSFTYY